MVVSAGATWGTIGGGNLEATVIDKARVMLTDGKSAPETVTFALNDRAVAEHGRQCCGGVVNVFMEPFLARQTIAIFGMGHVGLELARILSRLPVRLILVDTRNDQLKSERLADIHQGQADTHCHQNPVPDSLLMSLPPGSHVFIMTHDHSEDFLLCDAAIRRDDLSYVGLIGSRAKWSNFRKQLQAEGHNLRTIETINCPIGLEGVSGKSPAVIAISAAASILPGLTKYISYSG